MLDIQSDVAFLEDLHDFGMLQGFSAAKGLQHFLGHL